MLQLYVNPTSTHTTMILSTRKATVSIGSKRIDFENSIRYAGSTVRMYFYPYLNRGKVALSNHPFSCAFQCVYSIAVCG